MSHNIKKMLRIIDPNLFISSVNQEPHQGVQSLVINAKLTAEPTVCPKCGASPFDENHNYVIVKNGTKKITVRFEAYQHMPTIMKLAKQRYLCRNCQCYHTAQSYFVEPKHSISKQVSFKIIDLLREKISMTLIARLTQVSITTVIRTLRSLVPYLPDKHKESLPEVLMVDEFRSHAIKEDKMSFICSDGKTGKLIDVLPSRKIEKLKQNFNRYPLEVREDVKFLVTDMNAPYINLTDKVFPNACVVIDRFHVVQHMNTAFNQLRIREMKQLSDKQKKKEENKSGHLKTHWKKLLKNTANVDIGYYKRWLGFMSHSYPLMTEDMLIDRLLSYSNSLKQAYNVFHELVDSFRRKEVETFFYLLENLPEELDSEFRRKLQNLLQYKEGIQNALIYPYSNAKIEATNTHTKTLKRVSYGFNSFENMRIRLFLINGLIEIK